MALGKHTISETLRTQAGLLGLAFGLSILPYFLLRGWLNAATVMLGLVCIVMLTITRVRLTQALSDRRLAWMFAALAAPALAVILVGVLRQEWVWRYLDGPLRLLLGGFILVYFVQRRVDVLPFAQYAMPAAVFLCAAILLYPGASNYFWEGRVASYFMDPLTLAEHTMIAGFCCLFLVDVNGRDAPWLRVFKYAAFFTALAIVLWTRSRTAWMMIPILATLWFIGFQRNGGARGMVLAALVVGGGCAALYLFAPLVHARVDNAVDEVTGYFAGHADTSIGVRISLLRANWILFTQSPLYGWGFVRLPDLSAIPSIAAFSTPLFEHYFVQSGGHNEFMQSMMRMGVIGLVARLLVMLVPLALFAGALRSTNARQRAAGYLGLTVVIGYLTASLTSEVFNLVYAASFYALLVAAWGAAAIAQDTP